MGGRRASRRSLGARIHIRTSLRCRPPGQKVDRPTADESRGFGSFARSSGGRPQSSPSETSQARPLLRLRRFPLIGSTRPIRSRVEPQPEPVERPQPEVALPAPSVGATERPRGQPDDAAAQRLGRPRQRSRRGEPQARALARPTVEQTGADERPEARSLLLICSGNGACAACFRGVIAGSPRLVEVRADGNRRRTRSAWDRRPRCPSSCATAAEPAVRRLTPDSWAGSRGSRAAPRCHHRSRR